MAQFSEGIGQTLRGAYYDLDALDIFFVSALTAIAMWSLMLTQALLVDGMAARFNVADQNMKAYGLWQNHNQNLIPRRVAQFFNFPITSSQILLYFGLAFLGILVIVYNSDIGDTFVQCKEFNPLCFVSVSVVAILGILTAYIVISILTIFTTFDLENNPDIAPFVLNNLLMNRLRGSRGAIWVDSIRSSIQSILSWGAKRLGMHYILEQNEQNEQETVVSTHAFAMATLMVVLLFYLAAKFFIPMSFLLQWPPLAHVLILLTLLIWLFQGLQFHLSLSRVPTLLTLIFFVVLLQGIRQSDYYFNIYDTSNTSETEKILTPTEVAQTSGKNLVVVTSTGGGIYAAGWATLSLQKLLEERSELAQEIRLISATSGSAVGTAFYLTGILDHQATEGSCIPSNERLAQIHASSVTSSLSAALYGFSFNDFWRILFGGPVILTEEDRGQLIEKQWPQNADLMTSEIDPYAISMSSLKEHIRNGCLPAPVLNTTVMENGHRVMVTPIDFRKEDERGFSHKRSSTLDGYLFAGDNFDYRNEFDISIWTAARLSATFPYVSPSVRADLSNTRLMSNPEPFLKHHFIDGGYHDGYGVASALDWLDAVFEERKCGMDEQCQADFALEFDRVLIIQLRASPTNQPREVEPVAAVRAAYLGPLDGIFQARTGVSFSRNEQAIDRFISNWGRQFGDEVEIKTVVLEPREHTNRPLSWHLTQDQRTDLKETAWHPELDTCIKEIDEYLKMTDDTAHETEEQMEPHGYALCSRQ
ncbi:MAG: hypothetical protein AAF639_24020 [Chloroflexota bacterium]